MKSHLKYLSVFFSFSAIIFNSTLALAQVVKPAQTERLFQSHHEIVWGMDTNGYAGGVLIEEGRSDVMVVIFVRQTVTNNANTNNQIKNTIQPLYLGASNSFCGPIELLDASGQNLPMTKPEVSNSDEYPRLLSWNSLFLAETKRPKISHAIPGDIGLFGPQGKNGNAQLGYFEVGNYYKIDKSGEYQLKVWPKLYKQSEKNEDEYQRVDLPSVTVKIHLAGT